MKTLYTGASMVAAILTTFFFVASDAVSEDSASSQAALEPHIVSVETKHPLALAQQHLDLAHQHFQKGEMDKVIKNLDEAKQLLKGHSWNKEAIELANEIKQLQDRSNTPAEEQQYSLARLWHRSQALVVREIETLAKNWNDSSTANQTLKHIIDARMRFSYAEHDLFVKHDAGKARYEIDSTLAYLDKANEIATPRIREKIISLKKDIQQLPTDDIHTTETQVIIQELHTASISVDKVSKSVSPTIQKRSKKIAEEIVNLRKDIFILEKRQQYDSVMERLHQLDQLL